MKSIKVEDYLLGLKNPSWMKDVFKECMNEHMIVIPWSWGSSIQTLTLPFLIHALEVTMEIRS